MKLHIFGGTILKEKPGVISEGPLWIIIHKGYMYDHDYFLGVLWVFATQYQNDRHIVG